MIFPLNEVYIYTNGPLLSRRYITTENGTPITVTDIAAITLKIYKLNGNASGDYTRELLSSTSIDPTTAILTTPTADPKGNLYNFRYCIEGAFTTPNTLYLVEYDMVTTDNHHIIILAKGRTLD